MNEGSSWKSVLLWVELSVHHGAGLHIHEPLQSWDSLLNPVTGSPTLKAWWDLNEGKPVYNMLPSPSPQVDAQWSDCLSSYRPFLGPIIPPFNIFKGSLRTLFFLIFFHSFSIWCVHACGRIGMWGGRRVVFCRQHAGSLFSAAGRLTKPRTPSPPAQRWRSDTRTGERERAGVPSFSSPRLRLFNSFHSQQQT